MTDDVPMATAEARRRRLRSSSCAGSGSRTATKEVLHGVDLTVHAGEHVVIFGPSGSGKSTLLRTINLLEEPNEGSVRVLGVEYGPGSAATSEKRGGPLQLRRHVGMVFQQFNLFPHLTALDNIARPLRSAKKISREESEMAAARGLQQVGLLDWAAHYPAQLSGGQAQRVAIARALSLDPEGDAVRRADVGARPRARRRGARRHAQARRVGDDDGDRHARAQLRPRDRRLQRLHGRRADRRVGPARLLRHVLEPPHEAVPGGGALMLATYQWSLLWDYRSDFLQGLWVAIEVAVVAMVLSVIMGIMLAAARMSKGPVSWLAVAYINVFRGVPALVSVIWVYFGWSLVLGISFTVFQAAVIALVALYSAFIAEIYRAALEAIPRGQREAGLALGMTPLRVFVKITLPQATKIAVPNIGSMFIGMVKDTSVFTVIGLVEVVRMTQNINSITFQPFVLYTGAAFLYVIAAFAIDFVFRAIEKSMSTPPKGRIARIIHGRRRRRVEQVVRDFHGAEGTA